MQFQVLSNSMANALQVQNLFYTEATRKFIRYVDRIFDCLNVSKVGIKVKDDLKPFRDVNDERFEVLCYT